MLLSYFRTKAEIHLKSSISHFLDQMTLLNQVNQMVLKLSFEFQI